MGLTPCFYGSLQQGTDDRITSAPHLLLSPMKDWVYAAICGLIFAFVVILVVTLCQWSRPVNQHPQSAQLDTIYDILVGPSSILGTVQDVGAVLDSVCITLIETVCEETDDTRTVSHRGR